jgi:hypothetical protein
VDSNTTALPISVEYDKRLLVLNYWLLEAPYFYLSVG